MDTRNFLASKITTELEKFHHRAIHGFPQTSNSIFDIISSAKHIHETLVLKTDTTIILLKEIYGQTDFTQIYNIYRHSLTTLLLTTDFKIQTKLTQFHLRISESPLLSVENLRSL